MTRTPENEPREDWTPPALPEGATPPDPAVYERATREGRRVFAVRRGRIWRSPELWAALLALVGVVIAAVVVVRDVRQNWDEFGRVMTGDSALAEAGQLAWGDGFEGVARDPEDTAAGGICIDLVLRNTQEEVLDLGAITIGPAGSEIGTPDRLPVTMEPATPADALLPGGTLEARVCTPDGDLPGGAYDLAVETGGALLRWEFTH